MTRKHGPVPGADDAVGATALLPLLTPEDVSAYLGVPLGTLANWRYQGRGPAFVRLGRHVRYRASDVSAWIDSQLRHRAS